MANLIEQSYYQLVLGIRKEFEDPHPIVIDIAGIRKEFPPPVANAVAATLLIAKSRLHVWRHRSIIEGHLSEQGAAILTSNHHGETDTYKICAAVTRAGRMVRAVVKKGLVVEGFTESDRYLKEIGAEEDSFRYKPLIAFALRRVGVIDIDREHPDHEKFIRASDKVLQTGQQELIFLQPHRYRDCILRNLQVGVAVLARRYPDTPVYLMASSGPPEGQDRLTILSPVTYNGIKAMHHRKMIGAAELTIMFADMIAPNLPKTAYDDWLQTTKAVELDRLTSRHRRAA